VKAPVVEAPRVPSQLERAFAHSTGQSDVGDVHIRQIDAIESYARTKTAMTFPDMTTKGRRHPLAGQRVYEGTESGERRYIDAPCEADLAVCGAFLKFMISSQNPRAPRQFKMTDHDKDLLWYAMHNMKWGGVLRGDCTSVDGAIGVKNRLLTDHERKALIDDSSSGGLEIAPIVFDDAVIETPYLTGELFPLVTVIPLTRGRRIEGASISTVTLTSGGADASAIALFNTASFVAAFDTTIFAVNGAIQIGLDFLGDAIPDIGGMITRQYGQKLLEWLDEQIAKGDGTTEPEGIVTASGTVSVAADNGATGGPTVGDYETLMFGVTKKYKQGYPTARIAFCGTETSYQRVRGIPVSTSDARRVFGMDHESYMLFDHPYKINDSLSNRQQFFGVMPRYRMYRRLGLVTRVSTEGDTLMRSNEMLLVARARFGGQIEDGNAFAVCTDAQT
jgi:HK97 family phage major capsid protein